MKEIDILNGIAKGEIKPGFKIKNDKGEIYEYEEGANYFRNIENKTYVWSLGYFKNLNREIEIVEEDKKIEKIIINSQANIEKKLIDGSTIVLPTMKDEILHIAYKVNELIDEVNKLNNK